MRQKPETIAWIVMLLAFVTCIVVAVGGPLGLRSFVLYATRPLNVALEARAGIVTLQSRGRGAVEVVGETETILPQSRIALNSEDAEGLLLFYLPEQPESPVSTLQLNGISEVAFIAARTPRFGTSAVPHQIALRVEATRRLQVSVGGDDRTTILQIETPQGDFDLEEGAYTLSVDSDRTEIIVSRGLARVPDPAGNSPVLLSDSQLVEITAEGRGPILSGRARDILRNGDFLQPLAPHWDAYTQDRQFSEESSGSATRLENDRSYVRFEREGRGHIEVGIHQQINQNIEHLSSLRVAALLRVDMQSIGYCGNAGTECPLMLQLTYLDTNGGYHEWLQGFYSVAEGPYSESCTICEGNPRHIQIPRGAWYQYASGNLLPLLEERGSSPGTLLSISVYASGHSFVSALDEVTLLIEE